MSLNIKKERVHELAREAAAVTGQSQTSVIETALERYLAELRRDGELSPRTRAEAILAAVVAILTAEATRPTLLTALESHRVRGISAGTMLELGIVVDARHDPRLSRRLDDLLAAFDVEVHDVTATQVALARAAYRDFGKGTGHPAQLNVGDCFAYALARETGRPLLYVGDDFSHTDVTAALLT